MCVLLFVLVESFRHVNVMLFGYGAPDFSGSNLQNAKLPLKLTEVTFDDCDLGNVNLDGAKLTRCSFIRVDTSEFPLVGAVFIDDH